VSPPTTARPILYYYLLIAVAAGLLFLPFLGRVHLFDWDEINFAESAREMLATGNFTRVQIDYQPFWEKPPLFIWMQALAMRALGVGEMAARLPNALCGIVTLLVLFTLGRRLITVRFGLLWVLAYAGSLLPHFYFKSAIIDPWFNLFMFSSVFFLARLSMPKARRHFYFKNRLVLAALGGTFAGLAILTKGPVGLLLPALCGAVVWIFYQHSRKPTLREAGLFLASSVIVSAAWYGLKSLKHGPPFLEEFVRYQIRLLTTQDAGHGGPFFYHFIVLLVGCFPASVFLFSSLKKKEDEATGQRLFRLWMIALLVVVLVVFSLVKTKIIHYSSLAYFPISFLGAYFFENFANGKTGFRWWHALLLLLIGLPFGLALAAVPYVGNHTEHLLPLIRDEFAKANLQAAVDWPLGLSAIGMAALIAVIVSTIWLRKGRWRQGAIVLFGGMIMTVQCTLVFLAPRIEGYTQGAAIDFYQSRQGEDCYVEVLDFKSYAHLFYTRKPPRSQTDRPDKNHLLTGPIERPAYFVVKNIHAHRYAEYEELKEIGRQNGFVFLKRKASAP